MSEFYIYGLYESLEGPLDNCFYIGKGKGYRMYKHFYSSHNHSRNPHKYNKIKKIERNNRSVYGAKIIENLCEDEAYELEELLIKEIGLSNLTNLRHGGKGLKSGEDHPLYGKTRPDEVRKNISKGRRGIEFTKEHKNNISKAKKGSSLSDETKKKLSNKMSGRVKTKSHRENLSKSLQGIERPIGEKAYSSKLRKSEVEQIKYDLYELNKTQDKVAKEFNICQATVSQISREETWSHINPKNHR